MQRLWQYRVILLAQHLCHLLLQSIDALLSLAHLALRFLPQLFGAFAELYALKLSDQRLQPVNFAGVGRLPAVKAGGCIRPSAQGFAAVCPAAP